MCSFSKFDWQARLLPANIYLFKLNNRNTRKRYEIRSKLTIKTPERRRSGVFIVNFERTSHLFSSVSIVEFEQLNVNWATPYD